MPEQPVPIYSDYDFYVPAFEIKIKGQSLSREVIRDVVSVSYSDSLDKIDACQFTLNNWDAEKRDFKYSDPETSPVNFDPGTQIELYMGYYDRGGLTLMLRGQIVSIEPDFPAGGQPTLQLRALNQLFKLHLRQESLAFQNKTDSEIAQAVLDRIEQDMNQRRTTAQPPMDLELVTRPINRTLEQPHEYMVIDNQYPIAFLMQRARHNGYDIYIEEVMDNGQAQSRLHFHPPDAGTPAVYELVWGQTLVNFKPTLKTKEQVSKVVVRGWNPVQGTEPIVGEATWDDLPFRGLPSVQDMQNVDSALAGAELIITDEPVHDQTQAREKALDHLSRLAKGLVSGSGGTVGLPELRAGRPVYIRKLGSRFSGRYLVTSTTHAIGDSGYTTQFEARMEELR